MKEMQNNNLLIRKIEEEIVALWEQAHGNRVLEAHSFSGDDYLVVFLPNALSKAELTLTEKKLNGNILDRYLIELMDWVMVNELSMIEKATGKKVLKRQNYLDTEAGWIMFYFKLGDHEAVEISSFSG